MAHVLKATSGSNGRTVLEVATSASTVITLQVPTEQWYAMTADTLDQLVRLAVAEKRPPVRRR